MKFGSLVLDLVDGGRFRLDGREVFGEVPKALWDKRFPADARDRVLLASHGLLVRGAGFTALVGAGESVVAGLSKRGIRAEEVDTLVLSSLRPRHAAGAVRREGGRAVSTFPNATLYVQAAGLLPGSSPREIWEPYAEAGRLAAIEGAHEIGAGLSVLPLPGHDRGTQAVRLHWGGKTAFSFAGVLPTAAHVPIGWIPAHDVYPVELIETKKRLIEQAVREGWLCVFEHDPDVPWGVIVDETNGKRRVHVVALDRAEF